MSSIHTLLLAACVIPVISAHMVMVKPPIFGEVSNAPLVNVAENPGHAPNYPCKATSPSYYDWSKSTSIGQGESYSVQFKGQAVHGGGSCQFSLSKDKQPTAKSEFKVIHSIQGGCPMRNEAGNAGNDANAIDPDEYAFTMNPKIEPGEYTFAWTWFNKMGNREMYMNCAPIRVTASSGGSTSSADPKTKRGVDYQEWDQLPNMMVANNAAAPGCETNQLDWSIMYPDPGSDVEFNSDTFIYPNNYCEAPALKPMQIAPSLAAKASSSFSMSGSAPTAAPPAPAGGAPPAPVAAPAQPPMQPAQDSPPAAGASSGSPGPGSCSAGEQPCSAASGSIYCFSSKSWGTCNNGCAVPLPVAGGMSCTSGQMTASGSKARKMRHKHRRSHSSDYWDDVASAS